MPINDAIFPIFVPSKGRPDSKLLKKLWESGHEFKVFVEPQDLKLYVPLFEDKVVNIEKDDQGITYVRNFIHDYAISQGLAWYWMLDDDIENFYRIVNKRAVKADLSVLAEAQTYFTGRPSVAQASLDYQQFAWSSEKPFKKNGYCDVCVCISAERTKSIKYRDFGIPKFIKEDRDFTLQILANGYDTIRIEKYAFSCPKNGSNKGGLYETYQTNGKEEQSSKKMVETWGPEICKFHVKPDGRPDVRINWSFFKRQ